MQSNGNATQRSLRVTAEPAQLAQVRRFVREVAHSVSLEGERVFDLQVAVSEACANAVEHSGSTHTELSIEASTTEESITFEISDSGGFRLPPANFDDRRENRGLGLPLMVALMDEVHICRMQNGGTMVRLCARIHRDGDGDGSTPSED